MDSSASFDIAKALEAQTPVSNNPVDLALSYFDRGWSLVKIARGEKGPRDKGWPDRVYTREAIPYEFADSNIGVNLGASAAPIDIDLDCAAAREIASGFLPKTQCRFGRASAPESHHFYAAAPGAQFHKFVDPEPLPGEKSGTLLEIRTGAGLQTVLPGSRHPSGEPVEWAEYGDPATAEWSDLHKRASALAVACLFVRRGIDYQAIGVLAALERLSPAALLRAREWLGLAPQPAADKASNAPRRTFRSGFELAAEDYNREHPLPAELPHSNGTCPICGHHGCFGRLPDNPERWFCFSASHAGVGVRGERGYHGDALDLAVYAAGATRTSLLQREGYLARYAYTDRGVGLRFARIFEPDVRVTPVGVWYRFTGSRWERQERRPHATLSEMVLADAMELRAALTEMERAFEADPDNELIKRKLKGLQRELDNITAYEGHRKQVAALEQAESNSFIQTPLASFDRVENGHLFNAQNGTIDLRTGELITPEAEHMLTKQSPVSFDPGATCPRFEALVRLYSDGDESVVTYLQRYLGSCLAGATQDERIHGFAGRGRNGKGVLIQILLSVMGEYAGALNPNAIKLSDHVQHTSVIGKHAGKRFLFIDEIDHVEIDPSKLRWITSKGTINVQTDMGKSYADVPVTWRVHYHRNHPLRMRDTSDGMRGRLREVPFRVSIPDLVRTGLADNPHIARDVFEAESSGVLNWLVRGAIDYFAEGYPNCAAVQLATGDTFASNDLTANFIEDRLVFGEGAKLHSDALWTAYETYMSTEARGDYKVSAATLREALVRRGASIAPSPFHLDGTKKRGLCGVALRPRIAESNDRLLESINGAVSRR